ncbi:r2r3-MYB transcription factor, putative [Entamoeba invadens IP1]|uniref:R2r3-MYB transcription factor, putative n=1 Tax=Entamoeba invadens IP1 TaxID=370355 RepID=A0A0A1TVR3_ENTIV|nr:r2r3-MYB transcription factor, putative [Entamoeba invadens IP1]ELP84511.1 r2r3-MYB transcription factor, putative [Entamoeba invadens IP1]|eukprot:XP_004183857.1 r2r3-MYB transcription factor, putative [Entamoeba invadens IP1]
MEIVLKAPQQIKFGPWSSSEDDALLQAIQEYGIKDWKKVEKNIKGRNRKQCRERYFNSLMFKNQSKRPWTIEEDQTIMKTRKEVGNKWTFISKCLQGRSANDVKNRYFGTLKRFESRSTRMLSEESKNRLGVFCPVDITLYSVIY